MVDTLLLSNTMRSVTRALVESDARRVTKYLSPSVVVKATRLRPVDRRHPGETFVVTYGRPNFFERRFIKAALAAGEPFPVHRIQRRDWPES